MPFLFHLFPCFYFYSFLKYFKANLSIHIVSPVNIQYVTLSDKPFKKYNNHAIRTPHKITNKP